MVIMKKNFANKNDNSLNLPPQFWDAFGIVQHLDL